MTVLRRALGEKRGKDPVGQCWPPKGERVTVLLRDGARLRGESLGWFFNFYTLEIDLHLDVRGRVQVWPGRMIRRVERA